MKLTGTAALAAEIRLMAGLIIKINHRAIESRLSALQHDVTPMQCFLLHALSAKPYTMRDLSKMFMVDPSTLVPVIDALERKGLVNRDRDPNDRRRMPLALTDGARDILRELSVLMNDDLLTQSLTRLGDEKANLLLVLLRDLIYAMPDGETTFSEARTYFEEHLDACADTAAPDHGEPVSQLLPHEEGDQ